MLIQMPNVIYTPHCAWFSDDSSKELRIAAAKEVRRALVGRIPEDLVNCINKEELLSRAATNIKNSISMAALGGLNPAILSRSNNNSHNGMNGIVKTSSQFHPHLAAGLGLHGFPGTTSAPEMAFQTSESLSNFAALASASGLSAEG